ncbi:MAG: ATP-binding protein [Muribaculaceae bacterium]|nr:ATP-binding protein [Muribaculaceae bacterium]
MEESLYAIGQQDFKKLREEEAVYVDKTAFVEKIAKSKIHYYFLARPRRFGKSLFLSTLQYFYEGKRELFKGLHIDSSDWEWASYPVLRLDLNINKYDEPGLIDKILDDVFSKWEQKYNVDKAGSELSSRFRNIIASAHEQTGRQVVILVDEYDKPLVGNLNKSKHFEHYRAKLASIYSNFKSSAEHIQLVFLTGVSRFSKLSVFSDLNNLKDITFSDDYADICGITEKEFLEDFEYGISKFAELNELSYDQAFRLLKRSYDGYKFALKGSDIYNPWSLLNAMNDLKIEDYWNETGTPTLLAEVLKNVNADLKKTFNTYCTESDLKGLDLSNPNPIALLYQTGYLTLKSYHPKIKRYKLGIPNNEVKKGFFDILLPQYVKSKGKEPKQVVSDMVMHFILGEADEAMKCMQAYFAGIHFKMKMDNENNFHNAFFLLIDLIGLDTEAESATSDGSIDITVKTEDYIYVIELKYDGSAEKALHQIEEKWYARKFQADPRQTICIGVNFSSKTRCIEEWKILSK